MISPASFTRSANRVLVLMALALALTLFPASPVMAQQVGDDRTDSAISAAIELSRMRESGEIFELYDRMHPDARDVFPRQAFLAWIESGGLPVPVDDPAIDDAELTAWTWDVTGEGYDDAAIVSFTQAVERNGTVVEESGEWVFVNDGERWRWFPGLPASDLAGLADQAQSEPSTSQPLFRQPAYDRIDRFWGNIFTQTGLDYDPLSDIVAVTDEPYETGCGLEEGIEEYAIYYCTLDGTVYYDPGFEDEVVAGTGTYGFTTIIAHEWGHHIQTLLGIGVSLDPDVWDGLYPIEFELQADCLAGIYAQDAFALGHIDQDDIASAGTITSLSGDLPGTAWDDEDAHGNAAQRVQSFFTGYDDGFEGCNIDLDDY
ncbi:MAG: neutral zinc metallopeptidase [Chloroflexia bacterium]|nr:neutral zinc metallopeptidase [Chloroflexia bacterium]